jgi:hypothetical protein
MSWNDDRAARGHASGVEYLGGLYSYASLDPQPCRSRGPGTRNLRSRPAGCWLFTILRKCPAQSVEKVAQWPQRIEMDVGDDVDVCVAGLFVARDSIASTNSGPMLGNIAKASADVL